MTAALGLAVPARRRGGEEDQRQQLGPVDLRGDRRPASTSSSTAPSSARPRPAREQTKAFDVGDEVLTAGGIVGHVIDIDGDRVTLETSVGASFVVLRQYVLRKLEEPVVSDDEHEDGRRRRRGRRRADDARPTTADDEERPRTDEADDDERRRRRDRSTTEQPDRQAATQEQARSTATMTRVARTARRSSEDR